MEGFFEPAVKQAKRSLCLKRRCGAVVVKNEMVVGRGYNAPPQDNLEYRRCDRPLDKNKKYPTDKTCCVHAEVRAIQDALTNHPEKLKGADLFFASIDKSGKIEDAGMPYCTICSKMALDVGISKFWLWQKNGSRGYSTAQYHEISRLNSKR